MGELSQQCPNCGYNEPRLPHPEVTPMLRVEEAGSILGFSRRRSYREVNRWFETGGREGIPAIRFGPRTLRVPTARLYALFGIGVSQEISSDEAA